MSFHISLSEARRIALSAQGFDRARPQGRIGAPHLRRAVNTLGLLQIDFVNVLVPAHYLVPFSRLGPYEMPRLDDLVYRRREFTEQWAHEASIVPISTWPLLRYRREDGRKQPAIFHSIMNRHPGYLERVLDEVREKGPLTADEIAPPDGLSGRVPLTWYRTIQRAALETHFFRGHLCVAERRPNMARAFDLVERIVPSEHQERTIAREEQQRELLRRAARAHGVGTVADLADYYRMPVRIARQRIDELAENGDLVRVGVEGWREPAWMHPDTRLPQQINARSLLSPFDPVVWFRPRALRLFGLDYRIEIYVPEKQRRWGYYVLPFLLGKEIVARVDLKADRKAGVLRVPAAHLEPGSTRPRVAPALAAELRAVAAWLGLGSIAIGRHGDLADALRRAIKER